MLSNQQIAAYRRDGFIVVEGVLSADEVTALRRATDDIVAEARSVTTSGEPIGCASRAAAGSI